MSEKKVFDELYAVNVNDRTEKKQTGNATLTYLSWAWAWAEVKKRYPEASYTIWKNENGLPYVYDPNTGYMCYTTVTINGITHEMWLPVMDGANNAMKSEAYVKKTKYKEVRVEAATMFDINKTVMRCLTKNLAMFGLGLYIYAGEDLPEDPNVVEQAMENADNYMEQAKAEKAAPKTTKKNARVSNTVTKEQITDLRVFFAENDIMEDYVVKQSFRHNDISEMTPSEYTLTIQNPQRVKAGSDKWRVERGLVPAV